MWAPTWWQYFALELAGHEFVIVGGDGGPLPAARTTNVLLIAPGERFDVLLTVAAEPGTRTWLRGAPSTADTRRSQASMQGKQ